MKQGRAPLVTGGSYKGQPFEVDHIVPVAEFPGLGNELANLMYLPRTLNRRKSDTIQQRTLDHAQKFVAVGVLTPEDYRRLRSVRHSGSGGRADQEPPPSPKKVNLNRAAASTIEKLPGIGPKTAAAIISARPLKDLNALDAVRGIGPKAIETLRDLVEF
jgi:hypothetical protein